MNVLVCGGRYYQGDVSCLSQIDVTMVIHGNAKGADTLAKLWAIENGIHHAAVPALWDSYGKAAGFRRNSAMLKLNPDYCVAFPGGVGTKMMTELCERAGITVWRPYG